MRVSLDSWSQLRVCGPLPGRPAESGEFTMEVSLYGDPPGWWITLDSVLSAPAPLTPPIARDRISGPSAAGAADCACHTAGAARSPSPPQALAVLDAGCPPPADAG